jgi:hypothetical protein
MNVIGRWVAECWNCGGSGWLGAQLDEDECECPQCDGVGKIEVVRAADYLGAVSDRDALRLMLSRLLDVALVDGYGETVADEARALLTTTGGR